jgi:hypothetical protein
MSSQARSLLFAADRYPRTGAPENRLTEISAEVQRTSPSLVRWLATIACRTTESEISEFARIDVTTQFRLASGAERPDIRVTLGDGRGRQLLFYVEAKLDAALTAAQQAGYLATRPNPVILIALERRPDAHDWFVQATWAEVADEAWRLGIAHGSGPGLDWPDSAWTHDAPGEFRMLAELVAYLDIGIGVSSQASLTSDDLELVLDAHRVVGQWDRLFELIQKQLRKNPGLRDNTDRLAPEGQVGRSGTGWDIRLNPSSRGWPALDAYWDRNGGEAPTPEDHWSVPSLLIATRAPWDPAGYGLPAVGVGMTVGFTNGWSTTQRPTPSLRV